MLAWILTQLGHPRVALTSNGNSLELGEAIAVVAIFCNCAKQLCCGYFDLISRDAWSIISATAFSVVCIIVMCFRTTLELILYSSWDFCACVKIAMIIIISIAVIFKSSSSHQQHYHHHHYHHSHHFLCTVPAPCVFDRCRSLLATYILCLVLMIDPMVYFALAFGI